MTVRGTSGNTPLGLAAKIAKPAEDKDEGKDLMTARRRDALSIMHFILGSVRPECISKKERASALAVIASEELLLSEEESV